jgi:hypothetical protein
MPKERPASNIETAKQKLSLAKECIKNNKNEDALNYIDSALVELAFVNPNPM